MKLKINNSDSSLRFGGSKIVSVFQEEQTGNLNPVGSSFDPATGTWETYEDLESAIAAASLSEGDTLDLSGRGFCVGPEIAWTNDKTDICHTFDGSSLPDDITILGAYFRGTKHIPSTDWTQCNDGVTYYASLPYTRSNIDDDFRTYLLDDNASEEPKYSVSIPNKWSAALDADRYRFMTSSDMPTCGADTASKLVVIQGENPRLVLNASDAVPWDSNTSFVDYANSHLGLSGQDVQDVQILSLVSPNVAQIGRVVSYGAWTDSTGEIGPAGTQYSNTVEFTQNSSLTASAPYYAFNFVNSEIRTNPADTALGNDGDYIIDNRNLRVYYRPGGSADLTRVHFPVATSVIKTDNIVTGITFDQCTFEGNLVSRTGTRPFLLEIESAEDVMKTTTNSCHFKNSYSSSQAGRVNRCFYERTIDAHYSGAAGIQILNSKLLTTESRSSINLRTPFPDENNEFTKTIIRNCFLENATAHGQALSLYDGSWLNSEIKHNIFYRSFRPIAFQRNPGTVYDDPQAVPPVVNQMPSDAQFLCENNLFYWPVVTAEVEGFKGDSQAYISHNTANDIQDSSIIGTIRFRYNTIIAEQIEQPEDIINEYNTKFMTLDLANTYSFNVELVGNIMSGVRTVPDNADPGNLNPGHKHWDNLLLEAPGATGAGQYSCSAYDYGTVGTSYNLGSVFDFASCSPTVNTTTGALTPPGIRWTSRPNLTNGDVSTDISIDWYLDWPEDSLPATPSDEGVSDLYVKRLDDLR